MRLAPRSQTQLHRGLQHTPSKCPPSCLATLQMASLHKVILHLKDDGSPEYPGLLRIPRDTEFVVRVPPNRRMDQVWQCGRFV
jgi:hypothetical protein